MWRARCCHIRNRLMAEGIKSDKIPAMKLHDMHKAKPEHDAVLREGEWKDRKPEGDSDHHLPRMHLNPNHTEAMDRKENFTPGEHFHVHGHGQVESSDEDGRVTFKFHKLGIADGVKTPEKSKSLREELNETHDKISKPKEGKEEKAEERGKDAGGGKNAGKGTKGP